jgi:hypothetical protein
MRPKKGLTISPVESAPFEEMITEANWPRWGRDGTVVPPQFVSRSRLPSGTADRDAAGFSSLAAWHVNAAGSMIEIRIPWGLLYVADPSSHNFYDGTDGKGNPKFTRGDGIGIAAIRISVSPEGDRLLESLPQAKGNRIDAPLPLYRWNDWEAVQVRPYLKPAYYRLQQSFQRILGEGK